MSQKDKTWKEISLSWSLLEEQSNLFDWRLEVLHSGARHREVHKMSHMHDLLSRRRDTLGP